MCEGVYEEEPEVERDSGWGSSLWSEATRSCSDREQTVVSTPILPTSKLLGNKEKKVSTAKQSE